jgi:hypothetical protein
MQDSQSSSEHGTRSQTASLGRRALPYIGTLLIFALIFLHIPIAQVGAALEEAPALRFFAVFLPYSVLYWMIDSACLTWVVRRFNAPLRFREILPIRASMYLLSLINTNLGQGGVAWYLHRKARVPFLQILSSILFIALIELYQLFLFSTLGVLFYHPGSARQAEIMHLLRIAYVAAWCVLGAIIVFFAQARRSSGVRAWLDKSRFRGISSTFVAARPFDYLVVLTIKAPSFLLALLVQHVALGLYGIMIPFGKLVLFLPLVFLAAALPIAVAHLGTSQAAWLLFFSGNAPEARILAYSLAAHFTFMLCNGVLGLLFLPHASHELTALKATAEDEEVASASATETLPLLTLASVDGGMRRFSQHQVDALANTSKIYIATVRQDGSQSGVAPVWFTFSLERGILIQTGPTSWQARRIRRGSPVIFWVGKRRGPAFIGRAEVTSDQMVIDQIVEDYPKKYLLARFGFHRPTKRSFQKLERVAIKIWPSRALPQGFSSRPGAPAPRLSIVDLG